MGNRLEPRAVVRMPVTVSGTDADGNPFKQSAYVCDVSRRGARIDGISCLRGPGETIEVEYSGRSAKFFVVWIGFPGTQDGGQIGIRKRERNKEIWGRDLPAPQSDEFLQPEIEAGNAQETTYTSEPENAGLHFGPEADADTRSASVAHLQQQKKLQEPEKEGDRRQYRRYAIDGGAELREKTGDTRTWGAMTDISACGCYVEMYIPYSVGTELQMALEVDDSKIAAEGIVRVVYPGLGIGIEFTNITDENRVRLNELLAPCQGRISMNELRNKIIARLLSGEASSKEVGESLGKSESELLPALDELRRDGTAECMAGHWAITEFFKNKMASQ